MNQIVLGASIPFILAGMIYIARRGRASFGMLIVTPFLMILSALWAIAPDIPRLFGYQLYYNKIALDPRCDIFFWHYTIDQTETDSAIFFPIFVLLGISLLMAVWREIYFTERGR